MHSLLTPPNEYPTEFLPMYYPDTSIVVGEHGFEPSIDSKLAVPNMNSSQHASQNLDMSNSTKSAAMPPTKTKKGYPCSYCAKSFSKPSALRSHIYTHTGEKPFVCNSPGCGRRFAVISNLRRHQNVHKRELATPRLSPQERLWRVKNLMRRVSCPGQLNLMEGAPEPCTPSMPMETSPPGYFLQHLQPSPYYDTRSEGYPWLSPPSLDAYRPIPPQSFTPYGLRCQTSPEMHIPTNYFDHAPDTRKAGQCDRLPQTDLLPPPMWYGVPSASFL